jgi:predicted anti-sigma-YlaC factor YlaD
MAVTGDVRSVRIVRCAAFAIALTAVSGCSMIKGMAIKTVANTLSGSGTTFTSDNDPELVREALPFALKLYESLLDSAPRHQPLLVSTCAAFTEYSYVYIQMDAEALQYDDYEASEVQKARALKLFLRGRGYCWRAIELRFPGAAARLKSAPANALVRDKVKKDDVEMLYWSAASLGAAISAGGLSTPELLVDWPVVRALANRAIALDETWSQGALHELLMTVESQGEALGGSEERARRHFARAVEIQHGLSASPYVSLAMGISRSKQDRAEFERLMKEALAIDPDKDESSRLVNLLTQQRARFLLAHLSELFIN